MRMKTALVLAIFLAMQSAAGAEEIRMIGQSVMYSSRSILSNILDSRTHRTLVKAIRLVDLEQPLMKHGAFTVFAPDDDAFTALPEAYGKRLFEHVNRDQMARVLACHIIAGNASAGKRLMDLVEESQSVTIETLGGCPLTVSRTDGKLFVSGKDGIAAEITAADVAQSNGMIEVIDRVLISGN